MCPSSIDDRQRRWKDNDSRASILQFPTILKAKEMGLLPVVVDMNPKTVGFSEDGIIKEVISTIDKEGILEGSKEIR